MYNFRPLWLALVVALSALAGSAPHVLGASLPPPKCTYEDVLTLHRAYSDWPITLLDTIYKVPRSYVPPKLVSVANANIQGSGRVRRLVIADLREMAAAARAAGAGLKVTSAYRSYRLQARLYKREIEKYGVKVGRESVARPGHSEHQLGTTIDFTSAGSDKKAWNYNNWAKTKAGAWIKKNGWKYGFILSYPYGKKDVVCYRYEPWHYRYVGRELAAKITQSGLTLREYLWKHYH